MNTADDNLICHRFLDAANLCYNRNIPVSTDFLDLNKQTLFMSIIKQLPPVCHQAAGGYDLAERKVITFYPYEGYEYPPAFDIIRITPLNAKFMEQLTHRDYLGSILALGISRDKIGDILPCDKEVFFFCIPQITNFITSNLTRIRNTSVLATKLDDAREFSYSPKFVEIKGSVASLRLDTILALGFNISRNHLITYIESGRAAVNGRIITTNAYSIKDSDIISLRGEGRIRFIKNIAETKKNRHMVIIHKYV